MARLFQRAGAWGAASVALFFSALVQAANPAVNIYQVDGVTNADGHFEARYHFERRFAANDPVNPGGRDFVTRKVSVPKRNNPMSWVKKTPYEAGVVAAVAAAGWAIDELTSQVTEPNWIDPPSYTEGTYWHWSAPGGYSYQGHSATETADWACINYHGNPCTSIVQESETRYRYYVPGTTGVVTRQDCGSSTATVCTTSPEQIEGTPIAVPDAEVWTEIDKVVDASPDYWMNSWVKDPNGNPYIYPEPAAVHDDIASGIGADPYPEAVKVEDPLQGQGLAPDGETVVEPSPTPELATEEAPLEIPDDYAREDTLQWIKDWLNIDPATMPQPEAAPMAEAETELDTIKQDVENQAAVLGDLPLQSDFGQLSGGGQCPTADWTAPVTGEVFTIDQHCDFYTGTLIPVFNWLLYMATIIYLFHLYRVETTRKI